MEKEKILILGLSKSGIAAAEGVFKRGGDPYITEYAPPKEEFISKMNELKSKGIHIETGGHTDEFIQGSKYAITSPGIPPRAPIFQKLKKYNIPVITEIEYAYLNTESPFIIITGTNGKTTTTSLISHILSKTYSAPVCGNIGIPPTSIIDEKHDYLVCEVSSFQAEFTKKFRGKIAVWTNFTPDHIDWHGGLDNYFKAKAKLFTGSQSPGYVVLNSQDDKLNEFSKQCKNVMFFDDKNEKDCYIKNNDIFYKNEKIISLKEIPLLGHHNYQNVMSAIIVTKLIGMKNEDIKERIMSFKSPSHRIEKVRELNGITFYDDSKATNPESSIVAIKSFNNTDVALILGGRDKNTDLTEMCKEINEHIKYVILIGEATKRFEENLIKNGFNSNNIQKEKSLEEAIDKAISLKPNVVLLSPACSSFDMFKNFEERGDVFKKYIMSK